MGSGSWWAPIARHPATMIARGRSRSGDGAPPDARWPRASGPCRPDVDERRRADPLAIGAPVPSNQFVERYASAGRSMKASPTGRPSSSHLVAPQRRHTWSRARDLRPRHRPPNGGPGRSRSPSWHSLCSQFRSHVRRAQDGRDRGRTTTKRTWPSGTKSTAKCSIWPALPLRPERREGRNGDRRASEIRQGLQEQQHLAQRIPESRPPAAPLPPRAPATGNRGVEPDVRDRAGASLCAEP